jgi:hypothetical protein
MYWYVLTGFLYIYITQIIIISDLECHIAVQYCGTILQYYIVVLSVYCISCNQGHWRVLMGKPWSRKGTIISICLYNFNLNRTVVILNHPPHSRPTCYRNMSWIPSANVVSWKTKWSNCIWTRLLVRTVCLSANEIEFRPCEYKMLIAIVR